MNKLGDLLKELRGKESLREASKRIGISHTYLDTIEKGFDKRSGKPVKPTPETLKLLSEAYDHPYEDLMIIAGYIEKDKKDEKVSSAFHDFDNITEEEKEYLDMQLEIFRKMKAERSKNKKN